MKTGLTVASERAAIEKLAINTIRTLCMDTRPSPGNWRTTSRAWLRSSKSPWPRFAPYSMFERWICGTRVVGNKTRLCIANCAAVTIR